MLQPRVLWAVFAAAALCGCSHVEKGGCSDAARYSKAVSAAPVQIPDDLSPPDESDSLRLPPELTARGDSAPQAGGCLETPPKFNEPGARQRSAAQQPAKAPPPPAGDREISN